MSIPATSLQYSFSQIGSYKNLVLGESLLGLLKANDVLVKIHAVSLQYRDLAIASGRSYVNAPENLVPLSDMAGEIIAVGEDVQNWKIGDRVCANFATAHIHGPTSRAIQATSLGGQVNGVLTQYKAFPAHSLVKFPEHLSYEEASTLPCAAVTAYNALYGPVPLKAGDYVLVLGTGGVSIFALQFAVAAGAIVILTSSSDDKLKIGERLGAKHLINYNKTPDWEEEVLKITNGQGVEHVIEVGGPGTIGKSLKSARVGSGQIHLIGIVAWADGDPSVLLTALMSTLLLRGIMIGSVAQFNDMNRLIEANREVTKPLVDKVFPFESAIEAYAHLESQKHTGKVVIKVA